MQEAICYPVHANSKHRMGTGRRCRHTKLAWMQGWRLVGDGVVRKDLGARVTFYTVYGSEFGRGITANYYSRAGSPIISDRLACAGPYRCD